MQLPRLIVPALAAFFVSDHAIAESANIPPINLAEKYHSQIDLTRYWVSEKYDGARAWWNGTEFISRGGHVYRVPSWFTEGLPDHTLDGELWVGRNQFQQLMQTIRDQTPDDNAWREVRFMVFDAPGVDGHFSTRLNKLKELVSATELPWVQLVNQQRYTSHAELDMALQSITDAGGEGLMLKREDMDYLAGRHYGLLKRKLHTDAEAIVLAHLLGKGKFRNLLGSVLVEEASGTRFRVGTGFSDAERANPPAIGSTITFRYQGRTGSGKPRFARFLRIRPPE